METNELQETNLELLLPVLLSVMTDEQLEEVKTRLEKIKAEL